MAQQAPVALGAVVLLGKTWMRSFLATGVRIPQLPPPIRFMREENRGESGLMGRTPSEVKRREREHVDACPDAREDEEYRSRRGTGMPIPGLFFLLSSSA